MRRGEKPFELELSSGVRIPAMYAGQVESITVQHEAKDIRPSTFLVKMSKLKFKTVMEVDHEEFTCNMAGNQFPLISNSATTGHKLQGCTVDNLFVNDWHYQKNWPYVVLSRVRKMEGLIIGTMLTEKLEKYAMDPFKDQMLEDLQNRVGVTENIDYEAIYSEAESS